MTDTVCNLKSYFDARRGGRAKIVIWAHNTHIGDARASDMRFRGEVSMGQLLRERHGRDAVRLVGLATYDGSVMAVERWGDPPRRLPLNPALPHSYESVLHNTEVARCFVLLPLPQNGNDGEPLLPKKMLERAVGVAYRPAHERNNHYLYSKLSKQKDALIFIDHTTAVTPLVPAGAMDP